MNEAQRSARAKDLDWAKARAIEYLDIGNDIPQAFASMVSDLTKTGLINEGPVYAAILGVGVSHVANNDAAGLRRWIEGFN